MEDKVFLNITLPSLCREELFKTIDEIKAKITGQWVWAVSYYYIFLPEMSGRFE